MVNNNADGSKTSGVAPELGNASFLNITAATLVKAGNTRACKVSITTVSAATGAVYDSATVAGASSANQILSIPVSAPVGTVYDLQWPCLSGLVVSPGASGAISVTFTQ